MWDILWCNTIAECWDVLTVDEALDLYEQNAGNEVEHESYYNSIFSTGAVA
jgi:hypothetical protein